MHNTSYTTTSDGTTQRELIIGHQSSQPKGSTSRLETRGAQQHVSAHTQRCWDNSRPSKTLRTLLAPYSLCKPGASRPHIAAVCVDKSRLLPLLLPLPLKHINPMPRKQQQAPNTTNQRLHHCKNASGGGGCSSPPRMSRIDTSTR